MNTDPKNMLYGECASQGIHVGQCKVVISEEDAEKIQSDDVIITAGSRVDIIDALYRAAAVVSEDGGILSHASIICREMKKPCCVHVQNATQILTDGHIVEVNATKGEIFILTR